MIQTCPACERRIWPSERGNCPACHVNLDITDEELLALKKKEQKRRTPQPIKNLFAVFFILLKLFAIFAICYGIYWLVGPLIGFILMLFGFKG